MIRNKHRSTNLMDDDHEIVTAVFLEDHDSNNEGNFTNTADNDDNNGLHNNQEDISTKEIRGLNLVKEAAVVLLFHSEEVLVVLIIMVATLHAELLIQLQLHSFLAGWVWVWFYNVYELYDLMHFFISANLILIYELYKFATLSNVCNILNCISFRSVQHGFLSQWLQLWWRALCNIKNDEVWIHLAVVTYRSE